MADDKDALPDRFHTLKRTLLIFCSLILVTWFPGVKLGESAPMFVSWLDVQHLWELRFALWVPAAYYFFGFCLELRIAQHSLSEFLAIKNDKTLDVALQRLSSELDGRTERISKFLVNIRGEAEALLSKAPLPPNYDVEKRLAKMNDDRRFGYGDEEKPALHDYLILMNRKYLEKLSEGLLEIKKLMPSSTDEEKQAVERIGEVREHTARLVANVTLPRRLLLHGFEAGAGYLMFIAATAVTFSHTGGWIVGWILARFF